MCVATSIIVAGIAAGGTLAAAKVSSNAAKNAAKSQEQAGDKALAFQKEQYAQQRADFSPYQQAGAAAAARLGQLSQAPPPTFRAGGPPGPPPQLGLPQGAPPGMPPPGQAPPGGAIGVPGMPGPVGTARAPQPGAGGAAGAPLWTLQAPDGTTAQYPADVAQQFISKGARRVA